MLAAEAGDAARASSLFAESMALFQEMGDKPGITATHENQGHLALLSEDFGAARAAYERGLTMSYDMGNVNRSIACNLRHRGLAEMSQEDEIAGRASFLASRDLFIEMGDVVSITTLDHLLSSVPS